MTIEERAKKYRMQQEQIAEGFEPWWDLIEETYKKGATDQQAIDIEKAIDWLVSNGFFGRKDSWGATYFRKAMTESM